MSQQRHPGVEFDAVLDAAASCYLRFGVAKTTATDIAQVVGISRATLYRRFGSHEAIFLAVLTRESEAMAVDAEAHLAQIDDPRERILEGMLYSIEEIGRRPVHAAVFGGDSVAWAATQAIQGEALRRIGEAGVRPLLESSLADGSISEQEMMDLVDWILRILISFAAVPGNGGRKPEDIRRQLEAWFVPAFEARLGGTNMGVVRH
ncbi:MAG TPA: TetR/AcrR family transcriptional regulator [Acidimicrobiales bacterium]|jgi:AcrR family transcriptional regulator|nr:TetR/AcrR family transcriptional regulator [Acidimicrobiales bacterium]